MYKNSYKKNLLITFRFAYTNEQEYSAHSILLYSEEKLNALLGLGKNVKIFKFIFVAGAENYVNRLDHKHKNLTKGVERNKFFFFFKLILKYAS